jgi:hypothetical protein
MNTPSMRATGLLVLFTLGTCLVPATGAAAQPIPSDAAEAACWDAPPALGCLDAPRGWSTRCLSAAASPIEDSGVFGRAWLCSESDGLRAVIEANNLAAGNAYTATLFSIDGSSDCQPTPCPGGVASELHSGLLGFMDGLVAGPTGWTHLEGRLQGTRLSPGSQVQVLLYRAMPARAAYDSDTERRPAQPPLEGSLAARLGVALDVDQGAPQAIAVFDIP